MPAPLRASCSACGYRSARFPARRLAVLVPDPLEDTADGTVLIHPLAPYVLEEFDLSFPKAAWGGHLVAARAVVCTDCGRVSERQRLTGGGAGVGCGGWLAVLAGAFVAAGLAAWLAKNPFVGIGVAGCGAVTVLAALELGAGVIVRTRFRTRAKAVAGDGSCPGCGGRTLHPADRFRGTLPCPECGAAAVEVKPA